MSEPVQTQTVRVLLLEDNPGDYRLVHTKLADAVPGAFALTRVECLAQALARIDAEHFDIVLSDLSLPDSDRLSTVQAIRARAPALPLVVLTGLDDAALGEAAIAQGAQDYLVKNDASGPLLARTLRYAIERKRLERDLRRANAALERRVAERTYALETALADLNDSLASAHALAATASDAIITSDEFGVILSWNGAAERMFGYGEAEVLGRSLTMIMPQRYRDRHTAGMLGLRQGGQARMMGGTVEVHGLTKAGVEFPMELSLSSWTSRQGVRYAGIMRDIGARKRAEAALRESEQIFAYFMDNSPIYVFFKDEHIRSMRLSRNYESLLGRPVPELLGKNMDELFPSDLARSMVEDDKRVLREGVPITVEEEFNGRSYSTIKFPICVDEQMRYLAGYTVDVTDMKRAAKAMQQSEEWHRAILQTAMDGFWLVDAHGTLLEANATYCRMSGYSLQELMRMRIADLEAAETADEVDAHIRRVIARGEDRFETRHRRKDGTVFDVEVSVQYRSAEGGRFVAFIQDISRRKQAEAARAALETQLREAHKMQALGTLAGGVAHDFNNALATILGNLELARQDIDPAHVAQESLNEIGKASRRAKNLVQQILAFGRRQLLERKVIALAPVVAEVASLLRSTMPASVRLEVECAEDAPPVLADAAQIEQVLINLGTNAQHAVEGRARAGVIRICLFAQRREGTDLAVLAVQDNGCGMDESVRTRIFEPFFTTKPVNGGTGLGLSVVHGIASEHEASIDVQSAPGAGTRVEIGFPAARIPLAATAADAMCAADGEREGAPAPQREGRHILFVDDEAPIVSMTTRLLERRGYCVSGHTDPRAALAVARAHPARFDLAVTDHNMPEMSGLDFARALREIRADLPVVMASGFITEELRAAALAAGVCETIYKADTNGDLSAVVERYAGAQPADRGAA